MLSNVKLGVREYLMLMRKVELFQQDWWEGLYRGTGAELWGS